MATSYISALVIDKNINLYRCPDGAIGVNVNHQVGQIQAIPTPSGATLEGDYWAVPVGLNWFSGFRFVPTTADSTAAPTPDSFHVVKIVDKNSEDWWYVRGVSYSTTAGNIGYIQASSDAENGVSNPRTMPTDVPPIAGRQDACIPNSVGAYFVTTGIPSLGAGQTYKPFGWVNGVALPAAATNGYANTTLLLNFLNASWTNFGSPAQPVVWTITSDGLTLIGTETGGDGTDVFSIAVTAWIPS